MNIINFINRFPDEASCIEFIKVQRIQEGIICKKCTGTKHYWLENKLCFQCTSCGFRTSIKSGTVMENSIFTNPNLDDGHYLHHSNQEGVQRGRTPKTVGDETL